MADDKPDTPKPSGRPPGSNPGPGGRRKILGVPVLIFFLVLTPLAVLAFVAVCTIILLRS